jgi:hypothetical protein
MAKLTETVTVTREVPLHIKDLVLFARYLEERGMLRWIAATPSDLELIEAARSFHDREHGE